MKKVTKEDVDVAFELLLTALRAADDARNDYEAKAEVADSLDHTEVLDVDVAAYAAGELADDAADAADKAWDKFNKLKKEYDNGK